MKEASAFTVITTAWSVFGIPGALVAAALLAWGWWWMRK